MFHKSSKACEILGVVPSTLRTWDKNGSIKTLRTPGGMRLFDVTSVNGYVQVVKVRKRNEASTILYSRVSSSKQKEDLKRQSEYLKTNHVVEPTSTITEISDIGSGINFKRPGLLQILGLVKDRKVSTIVVASRDRLARFGFELIEWLCSEYGTKIVVLDAEDTTPESELGKDLMSIVQVYCCRWNGRRRYKANKSQGVEIEDPSKQGAKD
jgi:predicted site-specific integrase-resolvase